MSAPNVSDMVVSSSPALGSFLGNNASLASCEGDSALEEKLQALQTKLQKQDQDLRDRITNLEQSVETESCGAKLNVLEELVSLEQQRRTESEKRLSLQIDNLTGIRIVEQIDVLRQQVMDERVRREVDISAIRASVDASEEQSRKACAHVRDIARVEAERAITEAVSLVQNSMEERFNTTIRSKDLNVETEGLQRVCQVEGSLEGVRLLTDNLQEQMDALHAKLEVLTTKVGDPESILRSIDQRMMSHHAMLYQDQAGAVVIAKEASAVAAESTRACARIAARMQLSADAQICSIPHMEATLRDKCDSLRKEFKTLLSEESASVIERAQVFGRSVAEEFKRSIVADAISKARKEAHNLVQSERDIWRRGPVGNTTFANQPDGPTKPVLEANNLEVASLPGSSTMEPSEAETLQVQRLSEAVMLMEIKVASLVSMQQHAELQYKVASLRSDVDGLSALVPKQCSFGAPAEKAYLSIETAIKRINADVEVHGLTLQNVQLKQQAMADIFQGKLQTLISKVDSRCIEGFGPSLRNKETSSTQMSGATAATATTTAAASPPPATPNISSWETSSSPQLSRHIKGPQSTMPKATAAPAPLASTATSGISARSRPQLFSPMAPPPDADPCNRRNCSPSMMKPVAPWPYGERARSAERVPVPEQDMDSTSSSRGQFLQLLRNENIRLREQNLELREKAIREQSPEPRHTSMKIVPSPAIQNPDEGVLSRTVPIAASPGHRGLSTEGGCAPCQAKPFQRVDSRAVHQADRPARGLASIANNQLQCPATSRPPHSGVVQSTPQARLVGALTPSLSGHSRNI